MTNYAIGKIHLEGVYGEIVELFPEFQNNYENLKKVERISRSLDIPSVRFVQDLTEIFNWRDLFNEDYLVDTIDGVRKIRGVYPHGYTHIDELIKKLKGDKIEDMIIIGKLANGCIIEATELFAPHMNVSVVKDAIFDELAYFPAACKRLKPHLVTTQELFERIKRKTRI